MSDPDLEIREEEGWGGGNPDPEIRGLPDLQFFFFQPFAPQFGHGFLVWSRNKGGGGGPPGSPPPDLPLQTINTTKT